MVNREFDISRLPVNLEPVPGDAMRYRLTIELHADELSALIEPFLGLVKGRKRQAQDKRRIDRDFQQSIDVRRAATQERGKAISDAVDALTLSGLSKSEALKTAARDLDISTEIARGFMKLYRAQRRQDRNAKIERLFSRGHSAAEIAKRFGISRQTVYTVLPEAKGPQKAPSLPLHVARGAHGAGGGSRSSSGDRERSERREGLYATEAPYPLAQGSGKETRSEATTSSPAPLPTGEVRGCGGKAPTLRGARGKGRR